MANKTLDEIAKRHTLWAVEHLTEATGYPPTFREVAEVLGLSTNATWNRLVRLRQDGRVAWVDGVPRTLRVPTRRRHERQADGQTCHAGNLATWHWRT